MIVFHAFAIDDNNGCIDPQQYNWVFTQYIDASWLNW